MTDDRGSSVSSWCVLKTTGCPKRRSGQAGEKRSCFVYIFFSTPSLISADLGPITNWFWMKLFSGTPCSYIRHINISSGKRLGWNIIFQLLNWLRKCMILCICLVFVFLQKNWTEIWFPWANHPETDNCFAIDASWLFAHVGGKAVVAKWQDDKKPTHRTLTVPTL